MLWMTEPAGLVGLGLWQVVTADPITALSDQILGPLGLTVGLILAVFAFFTERVVSGKRVERMEAALREATALSTSAIAKVGEMSEALRERNRIDVERNAIERDSLARGDRRGAVT